MATTEPLITSRARKSRSTILKVAEKLFAKQGFQATTLRQISEKSGANGALVSYYFGRKEGLWEAVLEEKIQGLDALLNPLTKKAGAVSVADLQGIMRGFFAFVRKDQNFHRLAQRTLLEDPALKKRITAHLWLPFHDRLTALVRRASGDRLSVQEAQIRTHVIGGLLQKYGNMLCFYCDDLSIGESSEAVLARLESYVVEELVPELCAPRH